MVRMSLDKNNNVVVGFDGFSAIVTAYSPKLKAIIVSMGYYPASTIANIMLNLFKESDNIVKLIYGKEFNESIENICFKYLGKKILITKSMTKQEMIKAIIKAEQ